MYVDTNNLSDCILGMRSVDRFIHSNHKNYFGLLFENGVETFVKKTKANNYSVWIKSL